MLSRMIRRRLASALKGRQARSVQQKRWITPAPKAGDGPLMTRRADRELPSVEQISFRWGRTLPIFLAIVAASSVAIFNYQKMSSPIIASTLYALRNSPSARAILGDEIYFKHQIPWIHGTMNQMKGRIDVWFTVKGSKGTAVMRFASNRKTARGMFETTEWSLKAEGEGGEWVDLLEAGDPFRLVVDEGELLPVVLEGAEAEGDIRGFRQQPPMNR